MGDRSHRSTSRSRSPRHRQDLCAKASPTVAPPVRVPAPLQAPPPKATPDGSLGGPATAAVPMAAKAPETKAPEAKALHALLPVGRAAVAVAKPVAVPMAEMPPVRPCLASLLGPCATGELPQEVLTIAKAMQVIDADRAQGRYRSPQRAKPKYSEPQSVQSHKTWQRGPVRYNESNSVNFNADRYVPQTTANWLHNTHHVRIPTAKQTKATGLVQMITEVTTKITYAYDNSLVRGLAKGAQAPAKAGSDGGASDSGSGSSSDGGASDSPSESADGGAAPAAVHCMKDKGKALDDEGKDKDYDGNDKGGGMGGGLGGGTSVSVSA